MQSEMEVKIFHDSLKYGICRVIINTDDNNGIVMYFDLMSSVYNDTISMPLDDVISYVLKNKEALP